MSKQPYKVGDVIDIGGLRIVCVPEYLITRIGFSPDTMGVMLPPDAAESLLKEMRKAGLAPPAAPPEPPR